MSNTKQIKTSSTEKKSGELEGVIAAIKSVIKVDDLIVLVNTHSPEVSGVVEDAEGFVREIIPLGDGIHIVLSIGNLETELGTGIHEVG